MEPIGLTLAVVAILWTRAPGKAPERAGVDLWLAIWLFVGAAVLQAMPLLLKPHPAWAFFAVLASAIAGIFLFRGVLLLEAAPRRAAPGSDPPHRGVPDV